MPCDTLLFDLDGTLVDSAHDITTALNLIREERGAAPIEVTRVRSLVALGAGTLVATALGPVASEATKDLDEFRAYLSALNPNPAAVYPGVRITLMALAEIGWQMGIVTNKPERLSRQLLDALDLAHFFGALVGGDTVHKPKPAPEPVLHALMLMRAPTDRAIFVGDSAIDAGAARGLHIPFVLFTAGYGAAECASHDVAASFSIYAELPSILADLKKLPTDRPIRANL